jgi:4-hydroxybenzoate polyprenyltransferase
MGETLGPFDALGFGNAVVAATAVALAAAASRAMEIAPDPWVLALAGCGTLVIYGLDRLRDRARDSRTAPLRTAFVERHQHAIAATTALAAVGALVAAASCGVRVVAVAGAVAALGLAHRRIKHRPFAKPAYLIVAWTVVAVALPAARDPSARHVAWVAGVVLFALWSNVILSNLKDREGAVAFFGPRIARRAGLLWSAVGTALALAGPAPVARLAPLTLSMAISVLGFRPSERYCARP